MRLFTACVCFATLLVALLCCTTPTSAEITPYENGRFHLFGVIKQVLDIAPTKFTLSLPEFSDVNLKLTNCTFRAFLVPSFRPITIGPERSYAFNTTTNAIVIDDLHTYPFEGESEDIWFSAIVSADVINPDATIREDVTIATYWAGSGSESTKYTLTAVQPDFAENSRLLYTNFVMPANTNAISHEVVVPTFYNPKRAEVYEVKLHLLGPWYYTATTPSEEDKPITCNVNGEVYDITELHSGNATQSSITITTSHETDTSRIRLFVPHGMPLRIACPGLTFVPYNAASLDNEEHTYGRVVVMAYGANGELLDAVGNLENIAVVELPNHFPSLSQQSSAHYALSRTAQSIAAAHGPYQLRATYGLYFPRGAVEFGTSPDDQFVLKFHNLQTVGQDIVDQVFIQDLNQTSAGYNAQRARAFGFRDNLVCNLTRTTSTTQTTSRVIDMPKCFAADNTVYTTPEQNKKFVLHTLTNVAPTTNLQDLDINTNPHALFDVTLYYRTTCYNHRTKRDAPCTTIIPIQDDQTVRDMYDTNIFPQRTMNDISMTGEIGKVFTLTLPLDDMAPDAAPTNKRRIRFRASTGSVAFQVPTEGGRSCQARVVDETGVERHVYTNIGDVSFNEVYEHVGEDKMNIGELDIVFAEGFKYKTNNVTLSCGVPLVRRWSTGRSEKEVVVNGLMDDFHFMVQMKEIVGTKIYYSMASGVHDAAAPGGGDDGNDDTEKAARHFLKWFLLIFVGIMLISGGLVALICCGGLALCISCCCRKKQQAEAQDYLINTSVDNNDAYESF